MEAHTEALFPRFSSVEQRLTTGITTGQILQNTLSEIGFVDEDQDIISTGMANFNKTLTDFRSFMSKVEKEEDLDIEELKELEERLTSGAAIVSLLRDKIATADLGELKFDPTTVDRGIEILSGALTDLRVLITELSK